MNSCFLILLLGCCISYFPLNIQVEFKRITVGPMPTFHGEIGSELWTVLIIALPSRINDSSKGKDTACHLADEAIT